MKTSIEHTYAAGKKIYWIKCKRKFEGKKVKVYILCTDAKLYGESQTKDYVFNTREEAETALAVAKILGVV